MGYGRSDEMLIFKGAQSGECVPEDGPICAGDRFVGRETALRSLEHTWEAACDGQGRQAVISGGSGIGKTRLAEEFAARVRAVGGRALIGFCPSTGSTPSRSPWSRALRDLGEREGSSVLRDVADAARVDLADLLPE